MTLNYVWILSVFRFFYIFFQESKEECWQSQSTSKVSLFVSKTTASKRYQPYITSAHFGTFLDPHAHYLSINTELNVSKNGQPTHSICWRNLWTVPKPNYLLTTCFMSKWREDKGSKMFVQNLPTNQAQLSCFFFAI